MTKTIGEWLDQDVYPVIFSQADQLFPEFGFRHTHSSWQSTTSLKANGSEGTHKGKVYLYDDAKHCLKDYRLDKPISLWRYLAEREGLSENKDIVQYLATISGVPLPDRPHTSSPKKPKSGVHPAVLQAAHRYMQERLTHDERAGELWQYLSGRGYENSDIEAMGLAFLPEQAALKQHLLDADHSPACVEFFLRKLTPAMGTSHQLAIPCYGAGQRLEGFSFRSLQAEGGDKYRNMRGLKKSGQLLDFAIGTKDLTVVEGIFDAKIARARGLEGVVPLNGTHINAKQVQAMQARGVERLTLCLDNDEAGLKATWNIVRKLVKQCPDIRLFIAQLPNGVKDPDELIRVSGIDAFQQVIDTAMNAGQYFADVIYKPRLEKYDMPTLTAKERDEIFAYCQETALTLTHPRDLYDYVSSMSEVLPAMAFFAVKPSTMDAAS
ncbi:MAG: toprim domain-containing protein [Leptolyngbya sp. SIOISBB]|nr:toprim domain-containing protein [Leptolyngbya sp. SIOISBB]